MIFIGTGFMSHWRWVACGVDPSICILLTDKIKLYSHAFLWLCCVRHEILPIYNVVSIKSIYFIKCLSISHIGAIGLCTVTAVLNVILDDKLSNF